MVELNVGIDLGLQAFDQLFIAVLDRIQANIAFDVHDKILQRIEPVGVVGLGGEIGARHHLEEAFCRRVIDFTVEQFLGRDIRPGVLVVVRADAFVIFDRRHHVGAALAERLDRGGGLRPVFAAHPRHVVEQFAVELHLLGIHRNGLQPEMLDQLPQRIGAGHRVVVDLGDAGLVHRGRGIEFTRDDLAADPVGRLINGDAAELPQFLLQIPGTHQATGPAPDNCKIQHVFPSSPVRPIAAGRSKSP